MIEKTIIDYLNNNLAVPVYMETQEEPPTRYVLIEKTGGSEENHLKSATFAVQSYAESLYKAAELNETVKTVMKNITTLDDIAKCQLNSDYNFTDTETKKYRYQAVYDFKHY